MLSQVIVKGQNIIGVPLHNPSLVMASYLLAERAWK